MKLKYIVLCSFMLSMLSCSLNYDPVDVYSDVTEGVTQDSVKVVFKDKAAVLNQRQIIHDRLRASGGQEYWYQDMLLLGETHADNAYAGQPGAETTPFEVNSIEGSNINLNRDWNWHMGSVSAANLLICYIDSVNDSSLAEVERKQYKAEAKIFRAMVYFDMVRIWGNVPLVTSVAGDITAETIKEVYPAYFPPQTDEKTVYEQIERDLLEALPDAPDNNPGDKTQMSKSVARALLAKVYAEKPLRDYAKVIQYCDELTADGFSLVADFGELFGVVLEDNTQPAGPTNRALNALHNTKETILEAYFGPGSGSWVTWMFGRPLNDWNDNFSWAKWITPSRDIIKAFKNEPNDKRMDESIVYYACGWSIYYPKDNYAFMYKCRSAYNSLIKFRYADILLLKAEALIMGSGDLSAAAAIINQTRSRAGLGSLSSSATASKEALLNAYLKERRLELAFEGQRWFDLVRLDKVESVLNDLKDEGRPALVYPYDANSYRLPIPQAVMDQNPNLIQNPGY